MKRTTNINARLSEIVKINRCIAEEAICDIMYDALREMGNFLVEAEIEEGSDLLIEKAVAGFPPYMLNNIKGHALREDIGEWIKKMDESEKLRMTLVFLDYYGKNRMDFRRKFPNAFKKWTDAEDGILMNEYGKSAGCPDWKQMEKDFGRNANALKMRLEKLGFISK